MKRKDFIKHIKKYGYVTTNKFNGSHEIFKNKETGKIFVVPTGKDIKKGIFWNFETLRKKGD